MAYVAGPMRRRPYLNFRAFFRAERALRALGWDVLNPARMDVEDGYRTRAGLPGPNHLDLRLPSSWRVYARRDLGVLFRLRAERGDAIVTLPHWKRSIGARAENAVARWVGLRRVTLRAALRGGRPR